MQYYSSFITEQKLQPGEVLVSFDAVSLFTNVPTELAINVARKRLLQDDTLEVRTLLMADQIISLLQLCLDATYMSFQGSYYRQSLVQPWAHLQGDFCHDLIMGGFYVTC